MLYLIDSNAIQNSTSLKRMLKSLALVILFLSATLSHGANAQPKAVWYRYYDGKGVANISTSVTPAHIRYGYEALDRNMQVIQRSRPYTASADLQQSSRRESLARQRGRDMKLNRAYGNPRIAAGKRDQALANLKKQLQFQQEQLKQLQKDKISFKRQQMEYFRKGETVPAQLKSNIESNAQNIENIKRMVESLRISYRKTESDYAEIINRLTALEPAKTKTTPKSP